MACLVLAGCCRVDPPVPPRPSPVVVCPPAPRVPAALPSVASAERLAEAYHVLDVARQAERNRGDRCAETVRRFELWMKDGS